MCATHDRSKHAVKCTRSRIEAIWKKKQAMVRFLKKDVADLIAAGHESNAFERVILLPISVFLLLLSSSPRSVATCGFRVSRELIWFNALAGVFCLKNMKKFHCAGENWLFSGSMTLGLHFYFCFYFLRFHQNGSRDLLGFHCSNIAIFLMIVLSTLWGMHALLEVWIIVSFSAAWNSWMY